MAADWQTMRWAAKRRMKTALDAAAGRAAALLLALELAGHVRQIAGNRFVQMRARGEP